MTEIGRRKTKGHGNSEGGGGDKSIHRIDENTENGKSRTNTFHIECLLKFQVSLLKSVSNRIGKHLFNRKIKQIIVHS